MFEELRVIELASVLAGPSVGQFLAELGADVVKVENPQTGGDVTRRWKLPAERTDDRSAYFTSVNWGKRSLGLDLSIAEGRNLLYTLVAETDVVISSYKPGDAGRLGVDYTTLKHHNPDILYGQITGYGPDSRRVGYDAVIQAEGGFMFMNGEPGQPSLKMPVALIDVLAGHQMKEALLISLLKAAKTGKKGGFVEISLLQTAVSSLVNQATNWLVGHQLPQKQGSRHPNIAPYGEAFRTADGQEILLAIGTDVQFQRLCGILDLPQLSADRRFITNTARVEHRDLLQQVLQERFAHRDAESVLQALYQESIPAGQVRNLDQVFQTPEARELIMSEGDQIGVRSYVAKSGDGSPPVRLLPPPHFGEHTLEIVSERLKMGQEQIETLVRRGAIVGF